MEYYETKTKVNSDQSCIQETDNPANQSKLETNSCSLDQARESVHKHVHFCKCFC